MNRPITDPDEESADLRHAEYVLGVLDAPGRSSVEREIETSAQAAASVSDWQRRLNPLADALPEESAPARVWTRISALLLPPRSSRSTQPEGLWQSLALWRWVGIGASALAAALLVVVWLRPLSPAARPGYMASTIQQTNGAAGWTVTMDLQDARLIIVPATPQAIPQGRAPELWLIPAGARPMALGMIASDHPTTLSLARTSLAQLGPTAALAVSIEPPAGSPTGQPTGAVIGTGAIRPAPVSAA